MSTAGKAVASEAGARVTHEGIESGHGTDEGRVDSSPATDAMDVDMTGQV